MALIIRSSSIHAAGCYTTHAIRKGSRIMEYTGLLVSQKEGNRLYEDKEFTYLFGLGKGSHLIDGHGTAAFLNHSCDPNCETDEQEGRIWISAIRDIRAGEELCYDYNLYDGRGDADCNCGSTNCRGTMYSDSELRKQRRKRAEARKKREARKPGKADKKPGVADKKLRGGAGRKSSGKSITRGSKRASR